MTDDVSTAIAPRPLVFLDTETTGLDPDRHQVWEAAYAFEDGPVRADLLRHTLQGADPVALTMNNYLDKAVGPGRRDYSFRFEADLYRALNGATIVAANPSFDTSMLRARWGKAPWHYRTIDIESFAMPILIHDRPASLARIVRDLTGRGYTIPEPDHSARDDVRALRSAFEALTDLALRWEIKPRADVSS